MRGTRDVDTPSPCPLPRFRGRGITHASSPTAPGTRRRCCDRRIGRRIDGPALIDRAASDHRRRTGLARGERTDTRVVLTRSVARGAAQQAHEAVDPVLLEVFANLFMAIAEEMGVTLQNTATSVNIKERLDFSCAMFDARGRRWSPTRRTCRCIWVRWAIASRRSCSKHPRDARGRRVRHQCAL